MNIWLSASAINLWSECQRKWGFRYLEKIETPQHPSAILGTEVHEAQLGPYLIHDRPFDFTRPSGEIAAQLMPLLPEPKTAGLVVERKFEIPSPTGKFGYVGYIDLYAPDSACVPGLDGGRPLLGDFKTTSNLAYAKTSDALRTDTQAMLYSMALMFEEGASELDAVWFYARTRKPHRAQRVHLRVQAAHVAEQFQRIDAIGAEVATIRSASPRVEELKPNPLMCDQYGGCPYRHRCNLGPAVQAAAVNEEAVRMNTDFLAQLRKNVGGEVKIEAVQAPRPSGAESIPDALPTWATAPVDPMKVAINPPESALPPTPPVGAASPAVEEPKAKRGRPAKAAVEAAPAAIDYDVLAEKVVSKFFERLKSVA